MISKEGKYTGLLTAMFVTFYILSNLVASRPIQLGSLTFVGAVFFYPFTFLLADLLVEVYGFAVARRVVWTSIVSRIIILLGVTIVLVMPTPTVFKAVGAYNIVLGATIRVIIAGLISHFISSFINDIVMAKMKQWQIKWDSKHKHLWMRTVGSTVVAQLASSLIFIPGVFLFTMPTKALIQMIVLQWIVKCAIEIVLVPVVYPIVAALKKAERLDVTLTDQSKLNPFSLSLENNEKNNV